MFPTKSELLVSISDSLGLFGHMIEQLVLTAPFHNCAVSKAGPGNKWHFSTNSYELTKTRLCYFGGNASDEHFTSFHISFDELWTKIYGKHLKK